MMSEAGPRPFAELTDLDILVDLGFSTDLAWRRISQGR